MIEALWWFLGSESVGAFLFGPAFLTAPFRVPQYVVTRVSGVERHQFRHHVRKDIGTVTNFCDKCNAWKGNWIHFRDDEGEISVYDPDEDATLRESKIRKLEVENTKWRFANDPEWVAVFGSEYDPETFERIPQFHNGECGGPHDSCERCNWEKASADKAEAEAKKKHHLEEQKIFVKKENVSEQSSQLLLEELKGYESILWNIWNTAHNLEDAQEEWVDIRDDIGMLKDEALRSKIKRLGIFSRLEYFLRGEANTHNWSRREEAWRNKLDQDRAYQRPRY